MTLALSPLDAVHRRAGARMVPFGGWTMPVSYPSGTLAEHRACRADAAVFDVSHLGTVRVSGPTAQGVLQATLTNDLRRVRPGHTQYSQLLDAEDASVLDDVVIWWLGPERFDVMPNASNTARVVATLDGHDVTATRAVVAVQGPRARERLARLWADAAVVTRHHVVELAWEGVPCTVAGTGYTGEDGVEIAVPIAAATGLWEALVAAGVTPAGLGARDTLRLEAGLPLFGHELGPGITPLQAGLGWSVGWDKGAFRGRAALEAERAAGVRRRLRGVVLDGRRPPRAGQVVRRHGHQVGVVTSGNFSPALERGVALTLLDPGLVPDDAVEVDLGSGPAPGHVVRLPFVPLPGR
ncbi:MAG TPA: glycine cleavage system aminomethyltransferase GcvT [Acidimicrobiales bacterium]|nr:glycine cleavage system aminomethyltransferase GcvT [Acidimicrobiales bacterium]